MTIDKEENKGLGEQDGGAQGGRGKGEWFGKLSFHVRKLDRG